MGDQLRILAEELALDAERIEREIDRLCVKRDTLHGLATKVRLAISREEDAAETSTTDAPRSEQG